MRCRGLIALLIWGQSVAAADLGTWGDLWPVKEPDMLTVIMQRLTALEQSGEMGRKMDAFKERVIRNSLRPPAVPGIGRTEKYGSRLFDPSVRLAADIRDNEGRVFARQGEVMNPLQYVPFNQTLYFINGDDPAQVAWMKRQTPPTLESKIILVQGSIPGHVCHAVSRQGNLSDLHRQSCLYPGVTPVCLLLRRRCLSA